MLSPKRCIFLLAGVLFFHIAIAQTVTVETITVYGLKKTRETIVYRELTFTTGDTLPQMELGDILERNRNNLLNLGLFNEVEINVSEWNTEAHRIDIVIEVRESWYIYAVPIVDIADRNFNVWWTTYNHSLDRLNLGARLDYLNFSGRNDRIKALLQFGYTPKQQLEYRFPYFNKRQSLGLTTGVLHSANKEVNYVTIGNKEQFIKLNDQRLFEKWNGEIKFQYRPNIYLKHELATSFDYLSVHDSILISYNPRFFRNGDNIHTAFTVKYAYEYDDRDLRIFPTEGIKAIFEVKKTGWGNQDDENLLTSAVSMEWNHPITNRFIQKISGIGFYSLSRSQPSYYYHTGLGTGQRYIRGYELYIINGLDFLLAKYQLSYRLFEKQIRWGRYVPVEEFRQMPVRIYISMHGETGHVYDPFTGEQNPLANRWLFGGGFGLNFLLYHNFLFQVNYNINDLGERGLFIHNQTSF